MPGWSSFKTESLSFSMKLLLTLMGELGIPSSVLLLYPIYYLTIDSTETYDIYFHLLIVMVMLMYFCSPFPPLDLAQIK